MQKLRVYLISILGGLAGALTVFAISSRFERQQAEQFMERMRHAPPPPPDFQGGGAVWGSVEFGPGIFTWFLAVMVSAAIYSLLKRWQDRSLK